MPASIFNIQGNKIVVHANLSSAYEIDFMEAVESIVESDADLLLLDFSDIYYISSTTIGLLVAASAKANENDTRVKLIATQAILNILTTCGIADMIQMEVVE